MIVMEVEPAIFGFESPFGKKVAVRQIATTIIEASGGARCIRQPISQRRVLTCCPGLEERCRQQNEGPKRFVFHATDLYAAVAMFQVQLSHFHKKRVSSTSQSG